MSTLLQLAFKNTLFFLRFKRSLLKNSRYSISSICLLILLFFYTFSDAHAGGGGSKLSDEERDAAIGATIQKYVNFIPGIPAIFEAPQCLLTKCQKPTRSTTHAAMSANIFAVPLEDASRTTKQTIFGKSRDREGRIRPDGRENFNRVNQWPYSAYGVVTMRFPKMGPEIPDGQGTGCLISPTVVLTCAHNLYNTGLGKRATLVHFFPAINETTLHFGPACVKNFYYPEKYAETDDIAYENSKIGRYTDTEEDYGIIILDTPLGNETGHFGMGLFLEDDIRRFVLSVIGYPLNKRPRDHTGRLRNDAFLLWGMDGPAKTINKDYIYYDEIDTTRGQSGSPVCCKAGDDYYVIGVHVGDDKDVGNRATLLTNARYKQINDWIKESNSLRLYNLVYSHVKDLSWGRRYPAIVERVAFSCALPSLLPLFTDNPLFPLHVFASVLPVAMRRACSNPQLLMAEAHEEIIASLRAYEKNIGEMMKSQSTLMATMLIDGIIKRQNEQIFDSSAASAAAGPPQPRTITWTVSGERLRPNF